MRRLAANLWTWILAGTIALSAHIWLAFELDNPQPIVRAGTLLTVFGLAVIARPIIRVGYANWWASTDREDWNETDPEKSKDALCVQILGPVMVIIGTLLSGYGDLLWNAAMFVAAR
jgi:hypothetical protein